MSGIATAKGQQSSSLDHLRRTHGLCVWSVGSNFHLVDAAAKLEVRNRAENHRLTNTTWVSRLLEGARERALHRNGPLLQLDLYVIKMRFFLFGAAFAFFSPSCLHQNRAGHGVGALMPE